MDATTLTYLVHGRGVSPTTLNYEQLQQFCRNRSLAIDPLITIVLQGKTHRKYRGYSISLVAEENNIRETEEN
jgi:hypothetical protein